MRQEQDSLGTLEVPDGLWGIHTQRALRNFPFSGRRVAPRLLRALALVKQACARTNLELGCLPPEVGAAIIRAAEVVAAGGHAEAFPLPALQGGAGTSINMNMNEVLANLALAELGGAAGDYARVSPLDHVNLHQSTNDVFPTAVKLACIGALRELSAALAALQDALQARERQWAAVLTVGRTELVAAVPMTMGAQFASFAEAISRDRWRTFKCEERLRVVNLGGTAIGTSLGAPRRYVLRVVDHVRELSRYGVARAENLMDQTANADVFAEVGGCLAACAANLGRIGEDLRRLQLVGELRLPAVQAGSSLMPGKVNPVVAEASVAVSMKVRARMGLVNEAVARGSLQLNEWMPMIADETLQALDELLTTTGMLTGHVAQIEPVPAVCERHVWESHALVTAFVPYIGYARCAELVQRFETGTQRDWRAFLTAELGEELVARALAPAALLAAGGR
jgi:aspartate ammonia-lyase